MPDMNEIVSNLSNTVSNNLSDAATHVFSDPSVATMLSNQTNPGNTTKAGAIFANFSLQATIIIIVMIISFVVLMIFMMRRPKSNQQSASNAYLKAFVISFGLALLIFLMEGLGWINEKTTKYGILLFILLFFVLVWRFNKTHNPMQELITKTYVALIRRHLLDMYNSQMIIGNQFGKQIPAFIVKINQGEYGGGDTDVVHYLILTDRQDQFAITVGLQSGAILDTIVNPTPEYIIKMWWMLPKPMQGMNQQPNPNIQNQTPIPSGQTNVPTT